MRRWLVAALLLAACSAPIPLAEPPTLNQNAEAASVLLLSARGIKCGAVAVGPHELVTALHCLRDQQSVQYVDRRAWGKLWHQDTATVVRTDPARDLALLHTAEPLDVWALIRFSDVDNGERVCWSHHGSGSAYQWDCGTVVAADEWTRVEDGRWIPVAIVGLFPVPGDSGAGLWDRYGRLSGICVAFDKTNGLGLFLHSEAVAELMRK